MGTYQKFVLIAPVRKKIRHEFISFQTKQEDYNSTQPKQGDFKRSPRKAYHDPPPQREPYLDLSQREQYQDLPQRQSYQDLPQRQPNQDLFQREAAVSVPPPGKGPVIKDLCSNRKIKRFFTETNLTSSGHQFRGTVDGLFVSSN